MADALCSANDEDDDGDGDGWPAPPASTINTTGQQHWPPPSVSTTGRHHWPGALATCSKHVDDDDDDDDADDNDYDDDDDDWCIFLPNHWPALLTPPDSTSDQHHWPAALM